MPIDLTPEQRTEALTVIAHEIAGVTHRAVDYADEAERILDALLADGWRPEPQPDAIAAAEARGRREGIEAAVSALSDCEPPDRHSQPTWASYEAGVEATLLAARSVVRALSSIPPQEADPT